MLEGRNSVTGVYELYDKNDEEKPFSKFRFLRILCSVCVCIFFLGFSMRNMKMSEPDFPFICHTPFWFHIHIVELTREYKPHINMSI